jgi:hypothetical protein
MTEEKRELRNMEENYWFDEFGNQLEGPAEGAFFAPMRIRSASSSGVSKEVISRLKFDYPSLQAINGHNTETTNGVLVINLPGVLSHHDDSQVMYKLVIDVRDFPHAKPQAFVFTPSCNEIQHCNIFTQKPYSLWPNRHLCAVCDGIEGPHWSSFSGDAINLFGNWLNQLCHVLNNPNPGDPAREV